MKKNKTSNFSFIIFDKIQPPRFFSINSRVFKVLLILLPTITILSLLSLSGVFLYFDQIKKIAESKQPALINKLEQDKIQIQEEVKELKKFNEQLLTKLTSVKMPSLNILSLFYTTPGMKDQTAKPVFAIEQTEVFSQDQEVKLRFNIVNLQGESVRQSGYVFVIMKDSRGFFFYPLNNLEEDEMQFKYNQGESFVTSRFRPVEATFPKVKENDSVLFKILIFNRLGDLIHKQIIARNIGV